MVLYAGEGVTQYWIVDVNARRIEVYSQPRGGKKAAYRKRTDYVAGESVPVIVGGKRVGAIPVDELMP